MATVPFCEGVMQAAVDSILKGSLFRSAIPFGLFVGAAVALQWAGGAFQSELGGYPDEPCHYINGLLVRDYLTSFELTSPIRFAENYYLHYPKVSLGHWPPVFYFLQAVWTLLFSIRYPSILILMALLAGSLALTVFRTLKREFGLPIAYMAGLIFVSLPITQEHTQTVMAEIPVTLLSLWATLAFARYVQSGRSSDSMGFALLASLAILTKGNAFALAAVPPLTALLSNRWDVFRRRSFWSAVLLVLLLCGPWYVMTRGMLRSTWIQPDPSWDYAWRAIQYYTPHLLRIPALSLIPLVLLGIYARLILPLRERTIDPKWAALAAFYAGTLVMITAIPAGMEYRFLVPIVPFHALLLAAGLSYVSRSLPVTLEHERRRYIVVLAFIVAGAYLLADFRLHRKETTGYSQAAEIVTERPELDSSLILISSDAAGEGIFIAEVARRDKRPEHIVIRASKVLCESNWMGTDYKSLFRTPEEMQDYLESVSIRVAVLDGSVPAPLQEPHQEMLMETMEKFSSRWNLVAARPVVRNGRRFSDALRIYHLQHAAESPHGEIRIPVPLLNKILAWRRD